MKIVYNFITGETTEVEVDTSIGTVVIGSRREEESGDRKERRHCYSLDAITYEGSEYGTEETPATILEEEACHV